MAGIYIHVPFCKTKCHYCDFYKTTDTSSSALFATALLQEIEMRREFLEAAEVNTIYFGGGTPSLLSMQDFTRIFEQLSAKFPIHPKAEITIEANPDDCTPEFLSGLKQYTPVNRMSMGVQSFYEKDLILMGRRHNARQAMEVIDLVLSSGFTNLGIDLIYGLPNQSIEKWEKNLKQAFSYPVKHISAYHLTYEPDTVFYKWKNDGKIKAVPEEDSLQFLELLMRYAERSGFDHYEISNFAKPGFYSQHNTNYWKQVPYLGLGPSAHSFNGKIRSWNIPDLNRYVKNINSGAAYSESENIDTITAYNEYVMLGLRTKWGVSMERIASDYGSELATYFLKEANTYLNDAVLVREDDTVKINRNSIMITDAVIADLFYVND